MLLIITSIPALLAYLSSSNAFLEWLVEKEIIAVQSKNFISTLLGIASLVLPSLILFFLYEYYKIKAEKLQIQRDKILYLLKDTYFTVYEKNMEFPEGTFENLSMRVWKPKSAVFFTKNKLSIKWKVRLFELSTKYNFDKNNFKDKLRFEIFPNTQGLIGECFQTKKIVYSKNVAKESKRKFNLDDHQLAVTEDTKFVLCVPMFDPTTKKINSIISFDLEKEVQIPTSKRKYTTKFFRYFCNDLNGIAPEIFSKKG